MIVLRFFNTVGPRQTGKYGMVVPTFVRQALAGEPITVFGDGTQMRSFTYVGDVVAALLKLMVEPRAVGEVFNIGNPEEVSITALAEQIKRRNAQHVAHCDDSLRSGLRGRLRGHAPSGARSAKIHDLIGYVPKVGLAEIIRTVIADQRARVNVHT